MSCMDVQNEVPSKNNMTMYAIQRYSCWASLPSPLPPSNPTRPPPPHTPLSFLFWCRASWHMSCRTMLPPRCSSTLAVSSPPSPATSSRTACSAPPDGGERCAWGGGGFHGVVFLWESVWVVCRRDKKGDMSLAYAAPLPSTTSRTHGAHATPLIQLRFCTSDSQHTWPSIAPPPLTQL